jgi:hypothetical protein
MKRPYEENTFFFFEGHKKEKLFRGMNQVG